MPKYLVELSFDRTEAAEVVIEAPDEEAAIAAATYVANDLEWYDTDACQLSTDVSESDEDPDYSIGADGLPVRIEDEEPDNT